MRQSWLLFSTFFHTLVFTWSHLGLLSSTIAVLAEVTLNSQCFCLRWARCCWGLKSLIFRIWFIYRLYYLFYFLGWFLRSISTSISVNHPICVPAVLVRSGNFQIRTVGLSALRYDSFYSLENFLLGVQNDVGCLLNFGLLRNIRHWVVKPDWKLLVCPTSFLWIKAPLVSNFLQGVKTRLRWRRGLKLRTVLWGLHFKSCLLAWQLALWVLNYMYAGQRATTRFLGSQFRWLKKLFSRFLCFKNVQLIFFELIR